MPSFTETQTDVVLRHADSNEDVLACFDVIHELRPLLQDSQAFLARVSRQREQGYRILAAWKEGRAVGLAGYRTMDNLIYGQFLYVDDLVTLERERGSRIGQRLLDHLKEQARAAGCSRLVLDTNMANSLAQRFYFRQGLLARGMHFSMDLA